MQLEPSVALLKKLHSWFLSILSKKDARESKLSKIFITLFLGKELGFSVTLKKILPYTFLQYLKTSHWSSHLCK